MPDTDRLAFGLVGCGTIASTHADALSSLGNASLVACCDIVPERAHAFAQRYGIASEHTHARFSSFLEDPAVRAVTICTPSGTHAELGAASLQSGRPTVVEKPMDVSLSACDRLLRAQRET